MSARTVQSGTTTRPAAAGEITNAAIDVLALTVAQDCLPGNADADQAAE